MKQKIIALTVVIAVVLGLFPISVFAETSSGDFSALGPEYSGLIWYHDSATNTVTISKGTSSGVMPNFYYNYTLYALIGWKTIEKVIFEDGITNIGNYTLYNLTYCKEVQIADSVKKIGDYAFYGMQASNPKGLEIVKGMQGVEEIGNYAFSGSYNITTFPDLPATLRNIGSNAFSLYQICTLKNLATESQTIGSSAFAGLGQWVDESERKVYGYTANPTFPDAIQSLGLKHQIIYLDGAVLNPGECTLEEWLDGGNTLDSWFSAGNTINSYIARGGTAASWISLSSSYPGYLLGQFGGSSSGWLSFSGSLSSFLSTGGNSTLWAQGNGDQNSWVAAGGLAEEYKPEAVTNEGDATYLHLKAHVTDFDVDLPLSIAFEQLADTSIIVPSNCEITNNCPSGPVKVDMVGLNDMGGWQVIEFDEDFTRLKVSAKKYSISVNGNKVNSLTKHIPIQGTLSNSILPGHSMQLDFGLKLGARGAGLVSENFSNLVVVVSWDLAQ